MPPVSEVVLVSTAAAVAEHVASLGPGGVRKPLFRAVARPPVDGTEAQLGRRQLLIIIVFNRAIYLRQRCAYSRLTDNYAQRHDISTRPTGDNVGCWRFSGNFWILTFRLALRHASEIVGIAKAATIKEVLALLALAVKEVARHQPSTGTGGLG